MTYAVGQDILDDEYNIFATGGADGTPNHTVDNINTVWATGTGDKGYGQTGLASVSAGGNVTATQWATLLDRMDSIGAHQGTTISHPANPTAGVDIDIFANLSADITTLFDARLDNAANGTDGTNTLSGTAGWTSQTNHTVRLTWTSADQLRYYFNAGGEVRMSFSRTGGTAHNKNTEWSQLCTDCGTIVLRARSLTKVGGAGTPTTLNNTGWYDLTSSYVTNFQQFEGTSPYTANNLLVEFRAFSTTQLDIAVKYVDNAADTDSADTVDGTITSTYTERPPSTTNLSDSWGAVSASSLVNTQT